MNIVNIFYHSQKIESIKLDLRKVYKYFWNNKDILFTSIFIDICLKLQ